MAKRIRDHKAEYQRRKELAKQSGTTSVRKYKKLRKALALPRTTRVNTAFRDQAKAWSKQHSRLPTSKYKETFTDEELAQYYRAFVRDYDSRDDKLAALHNYLVGNDLVSESEWEQNYLPQSS